MSAGYSLKDDLFNADTVGRLARGFGATGRVDGRRLEQSIMTRLPELELKQRISWIADCLCAELPADLPQAEGILRAALPPPLDPTKTDDDFGSFIIAPIGEVVVRLGLSDEPDLSLDLLAEITQRFSMEMAIRPFLSQWPDKTLARMAHWAVHENYHVRRLVSEGTRPRLPWAPRVSIDIAAPLPFLDILHADPTRYVTRSVANHLNDITKQDPRLAIDRLADWKKSARQDPKELSWITGHALRGLVKAGDRDALALMGFDQNAPVHVRRFEMPAKAAIGDRIELSVTVEADEPSDVIIDYVFWRKRANGDLSPKVHKMRKTRLAQHKPVTVTKLHHLKGDATTYRLYPGRHRMSVQINGKTKAEAEFDLTD